MGAYYDLQETVSGLGVRLSSHTKIGTIVLNIAASSPLSSFMSGEFRRRVNEIQKRLLETGTASPQIREAVDDLQVAFPMPRTVIVPRGVWRNHPYLRITNHVSSTFDDAIQNIRSTGRDFAVSDEHWLRLLLSHWCGWSATKMKHANDGWVKFLRRLYGHHSSDGLLVSILDSLTWPEDLVHYPPGYYPREPSLFLLATPHSYYVFDLDQLNLWRAGNSLEEVYMGLRAGKHQDAEELWPSEEWSPEAGDLNEMDYFPVYEYFSEPQNMVPEMMEDAMTCKRADSSIFALRHPLKEFPSDM